MNVKPIYQVKMSKDHCIVSYTETNKSYHSSYSFGKDEVLKVYDFQKTTRTVAVYNKNELPINEAYDTIEFPNYSIVTMSDYYGIKNAFFGVRNKYTLTGLPLNGGRISVCGLPRINDDIHAFMDYFWQSTFPYNGYGYSPNLYKNNETINLNPLFKE